MNWKHTLIGLLIGYAIGRITAFRMDIDEYHTLRMEVEEQIAEIEAILGGEP